VGHGLPDGNTHIVLARIIVAVLLVGFFRGEFLQPALPVAQEARLVVVMKTDAVMCMAFAKRIGLNNPVHH